MTTKRSQFGSLEQRIARNGKPSDQGGARVDAMTQIRHVWLDALTPALVWQRRQVHGYWEGLVTYVSADRVVTTEWVRGDRISQPSH